MDKRFIDFRLDSTPGSGSYLVGHDSSGTEFRIPVANLLSSIVIPEAQSIYVQYSANGSSWLSSWTSGCKFMRIKIGSGAWSDAMAIAEIVNVYAQIKVGSSIVGGTVEGVELEAGSNITLTPDVDNKKVIISAGDMSSVQSDWNQDDADEPDYIKNKPTIPSQLGGGDLVIIDEDNNINHDTPVGPFSAAMGTLPSELINNVSAVINVNVDEFGHVDPNAGVDTKELWQLNNPQDGQPMVFDSVHKRLRNSTTPLFSGDYNDLENKPTIPSKTSDLTNDSGFVTNSYHDNTKVDKETGKGLSTNDYTTTEKNKLAGIAAGAEVNVQSDWNQTNSGADDYIKNKPTIPVVTGKMDKVTGAVSGNIPTFNANGNVEDSGYSPMEFQSDWNQTESNAPDYIKNKPAIPAAVSGDNDGTNWTQLTIGDETMAIPQGGGSHLLDFGGYDLGPWAGDKTLTIIETNKRGYAKIQATGDLNLSLTIANTFENYILIYNSSASDIDITIAAVNSLSSSSIIMPDGGITVAAGKYCEISIYANSSYSVITASGKLS